MCEGVLLLCGWCSQCSLRPAKRKIESCQRFSYMHEIDSTSYSFILHFIIIIIISHYQHGSPLPSLATTPYCPLLPAGPQGYIPYRHRAAVCRFEPVILPLLVHVKESTGVHHLWTCPRTVSSMSGSSNFDSFRDGWYVVVQLLPCGVLSPELVQYWSQHSCVIEVKLFLHTFS